MCAALVLVLALAQASQPASVLVQQAQADFQSRKYPEARALLLQALRSDSRNPALWRYLALTDARLNQVDRAIADFQKALRLDPGNAQTYFGLGLLYVLKGNPGQAIAMYQKGLGLDPGDLSANRHYASILMGAGRFHEAIQPLQKWVEKDNRDPAAHMALVQCYVKSQMAQAAGSETRKFLALPQASTAQKLQLAKSLDQDKAANLEQGVLRNVVNTSPDSAEAHAMLGTLLANEHHFEEAGQQLWDAAKLSPDSPQYSMQFVGTLLLWKRYSTALKFLMLVKDRFGNLPEYQYKLALTYYDLAEYPRAIATLQSLAQRGPNLEMVQYYLGNCYYSQGDFTTAERYYRRAIQLDPSNSVFYVAMGQLLRRAIPPRTGEAIEALQKALKTDPSNSEAQLYLALSFEDQKEFAKAVPLLQQAIRGRPSLVAAHVALARAYYRLNRPSEGDRERAIIAHLGDQPPGK